MALTMMRTKQFALSLALAALVSGGAVSAQINPATAKASAQNAAQAANTSAAQSTSGTAKPSQTSATNPKNNMNTSATQQKPPQPSSTAKPQAQTKPAPAQMTKEPAKLTPPKDDKKKPPTNAITGKMAPAQTQKTPPAKDAKPAGEVTKTTKPVMPQGRRDPFITLVGKQTGAGPTVSLPPGKGGLQVSTLILQGIVSGPNGMIAVVANPQKSVYFLRVGDELFDGRVDKIEIGSVHFHEVGKDAFGKPVEREVTRKLNPSSGDQP
jgi:hypothetical protein